MSVTDALNHGAVVSNTSPAHLPGSEPLIGRHVTLERLTQNHLPDLYENLGSHADLWTWWPDGPFSTSSEFDAYMNGLLGLGSDLVIYAVHLLLGPSKGKAVGLAFASSEERLTNRIAELGLFFGPQLQSTRAGTEVVYLVADLFFKLNHRRLQWKTNSLNVQSRKAAERYGFVYEGTFRQHQINKGRNRDSAWYSIIDSEWPICGKAFEVWLEDGNFDEQQRQRSRIETIRESLSGQEHPKTDSLSPSSRRSATTNFIKHAMTDSGTALQSLLLFQSVASYGATTDSFTRIAESFNSSDILRQPDASNNDVFDARSLTETYLRLLKTEAKAALQTASPNTAKKAGSPRLATVEDAAAHIHLVPQLIEKLYEEYKSQIISEIREDEQTYDRLVKEEADSQAEDVSNNAVQATPKAQPSPARPDTSDKANINAILNDPIPENLVQTSHTLTAPARQPESTAPLSNVGSHPQISGSASPATSQSSRPKSPQKPPTAQSGPRGSRSASSGPNPASIQQSHSNATRFQGLLNQSATSPSSRSSTGDVHHAAQAHNRRLSAQPAEPPVGSFQPSHYTRWMQSPYTSPYRSQPGPISSPYPQHPPLAAQGPPRRSGGVQLPPFSINPQASPLVQAVQAAQPSARQAGPPPSLTVKTGQDQHGSTPANRLSANFKSISASGIEPSPSFTNLLRQKSEIHFSPGSSTGWKGVLPSEKSRPRSISPISDSEASTKRSIAKATSRRKKITGLSIPRDTQASGIGRRSSRTPSVAGPSSHNRTRSQSLASFADDASVASFPSTFKGLKTEVSTPTPGERTSTRSTRATIPSARTATAKRKRDASIAETPAATFDPASPFASASQHPPTQPPNTIIASRNFNKMTAPLMDHIASHKHASLFANPVTARTKGYYDIIRRPTDLKTIRSQIAAGNRAIIAATASSTGGVASPGAGTPSHDSTTSITLPYSEDVVPPKAIVNAAQLEQELLRMFANAVMFNEGDDGVVADTREMFEDVEKSIGQWRGAESGWEDASGFDDGGGASAKRRRT